MRKGLARPLLWLGASLAFTFSAPAFGQPPGGQSGGAPGSQQPTQPGSTYPGTGGPMGPGGETTPAPPKVDDKKFAKQAALGGLAEVELGKLAQQKASSDQVKQFAQRMVNDHSKANEELKQIASKEGIEVPDALDSKHQSRIDKLGKLSGAEFDKAYIKDQLKDHQQDVREFENESQGGKNTAVKQFATKTLPVLQEHLDMAKSLSKGGTLPSGGGAQ